jgi:hypothetical protein
MSECNGFWLEVMYPFSLAERMGGSFRVHLAYKLADKIGESMRFNPTDVPFLKPGEVMHADFYFIHNIENANHAFQAACDRLSAWPDSHQGGAYLVTLRKGCLDDNAMGELVQKHLGEIGRR